jgi:hypothetical protein
MTRDEVVLKYPSDSDCISLGRNGYMVTVGIRVARRIRHPWGKKSLVLLFSPINSRQRIGRCSLEVPLIALPALMEALSNFLPEGLVTIVKERKK